MRREIGADLDPRELRLTEEIAARYTWCIDERRADLLEALLDPEVEWLAGTDGVPVVGPVHGPVAVLEALSKLFWKRSRQHRHIVSNAIVERQDSTAATVCQTFLLTASSARHVHTLCTGVTRLDLVKRASEWSIARAFVGFDSLEWAGTATGGPRQEA